MFRSRILAIVCAMLTMDSAFAEARPAAVELEAGVFLEETVGDLERAIKIYRSVLEREDVGKRHAAEASFRIATCLQKTGNYAQATRHFLRVVKEFGEFKGLADRAGALVVEISKVMGDEGMALSEDDFIYFGDLMYALSASLSFDDADLSREIIAESQRVAEALSEEVVGSEEESLFADCQGALRDIADRLSGGKRSAAIDRFDESDALDFFMYRHVPDETVGVELFAPALEWKDRIAEALVNEKASKVKRWATRIEKYLAPLEKLPGESDEKAFALGLIAQARALLAKADESDLSGTVATLFEHDKRRRETTGMMQVVVEGAEWLPVGEYPRLSLYFSLLMAASDGFGEGQIDGGKKFLDQAAQVLDQIGDADGLRGAGKEFITELRAALGDVRDAVAAGEIDSAIELLENGVGQEEVEE